MTIASATNRVSFPCNGVTTSFPFPYPVLAATDLLVIETLDADGSQVTKVLTTDYTISGSVDSGGHYPSGCTVVANSAPASGKSWSIINDPTQTQQVDLTEGGSLPVDDDIERPLDRLTILVQRCRSLINRALRQPEGDVSDIAVLPAKVSRASKFLAFDGNGDPIPAAGTSANLTPVSSFINTLLDDVDAATARGTLAAASAAALTTDEALLTAVKQAVKNPIINGNMEIWQRGPGPFASNSYTADRWAHTNNSGGAYNVQRSTNVPTVAQAGVLFNYSLEVDVTTADAAVGAADYVVLYHKIEGYNWRQLAQRQFTLSFWASSSKTGVHCVSFQGNSGTINMYTAEYTINAADTWEYKTVTVSASPATGTWDYTNGAGLDIWFALMAGSNLQMTAGSWQTPGATKWATSSQVNVMDSTSNFFRITGVKIDIGPVATPIQFVPFEEELQRCMRYYQKSFMYAIAPAQNVGNGNGEYRIISARAGATVQPATASIPYYVPMRSVPTTTTYNPQAANANPRDLTGAVDCTVSKGGTEKELALLITGNAATAVGNSIIVNWTAEAEL